MGVEEERALGRVVEDPALWPALLALRGADEIEGIYTPADERGMIFDLATLPGADDGDPDIAEVISRLVEPASLYDSLAMVCRELLRLRLEVEELRRIIRLSAN